VKRRVLPPKELARQWRSAAIANTLAAAVVIVLSGLFLPLLVTVLVTLLMVAGIGATWNLDRRFQRRTKRG
jgi:Flp pilus assembly protein TadB